MRGGGAGRPAPEPGRIAFVRQRRYLVEDVAEPGGTGEATLVRLSCLDDDAQGRPLAVLWEHELDARILEDDGWQAVARKDFDEPALFAAYLRTLSWNCVTATDPNLFQAPFRAGIRLDAYQLEPLWKALRLPRVNLFIADDVGLGKTIEAGLIARELLLRRRVDRIVVACPPSMLEQWRDEMEARFGLAFTILDRAHVTRMRRERGFAVNPWTTHSRFLVSHRLLIDETYAAGLRDWLGGFAPRTLLILDEAHHAAPSSGARYAVDSQTTRAVRDVAPRFEHRLFLSATPHNGHSNSFSALLEILDPQRFCRGVKVLKGQLDDVMVRRLKSDVREIEGGFPRRTVEQIDVEGLPPDAPELVLAEKLSAYRGEREKRLAHAVRSRQAAGALAVAGLQKRLLSSIEAFARTLAVHRKGILRALEKPPAARDVPRATLADLEAITAGTDRDAAASEADDAAGLDGDPQRDGQEGRDGPDPERELAERMETATLVSSGAASSGERAALRRELRLVDEMLDVADANRHAPDPRVGKIIDWIGEHMCPGLTSGAASPRWNDRRVIVFTEYEDTRRYLERCLREAIARTDRPQERIAVFSGVTPRPAREEIKHAFNTEPNDHPLRILIATDAAREGLNLQRHCADLFHFDLPWNPSRLDQRNGRIDRKLQPAAEVFCRYFYYRQRREDDVLRVLVNKADRIREELGSVAAVLERRVADTLEREGLRRDRLAELADGIERMSAHDERKTVEEELEEARTREDRLRRSVEVLQGRLDRSRRRIGVTPAQFRRTLSVSLRLAGVPEGIQEVAGRTARGAPAVHDRPIAGDALGGTARGAPAAHDRPIAGDALGGTPRGTPAAHDRPIAGDALGGTPRGEDPPPPAPYAGAHGFRPDDEPGDAMGAFTRGAPAAGAHAFRPDDEPGDGGSPPPVRYEGRRRGAFTTVDRDAAPGWGAPPAARVFEFPVHRKLVRDPGWTAALDTLRERRRPGESVGRWRRRASVKPVTFEDTGRLGDKAVHLHLEHRVARRLLNRFTAQGLIHHDLSKACLTAAPGRDTRVVLLGRLAVYGRHAARLHEEVVPVTARWIDAARRPGGLVPYGRAGEQTTLAALQAALDDADDRRIPGPVRARFAASAAADVRDLKPHLERRAQELVDEARRQLADRAGAESRNMRDLLDRQRMRIAAAVRDSAQPALDFDAAERRQHEADRRAWDRRLRQIEDELESEPRRIAETYAVRAVRVDPVGIVYLWPATV